MARISTVRPQEIKIVFHVYWEPHQVMDRTSASASIWVTASPEVAVASDGSLKIINFYKQEISKSVKWDEFEEGSLSSCSAPYEGVVISSKVWDVSKLATGTNIKAIPIVAGKIIDEENNVLLHWGDQDLYVTVNAASTTDQPLSVSLKRTAGELTNDLPLWVVIKRTTDAISFENYKRYMNIVLCGDIPSKAESERYKLELEEERWHAPAFDQLRRRRFLPFTDVDAYRLLKVATEAFMMVNCGVALNPPRFSDAELNLVNRRAGVDIVSAKDLDSLWTSYLVKVNGGKDLTLPYLYLVKENLGEKRLKNQVFAVDGFPEECIGILREKLTRPCLLELIWSYFHEEGMLVQTMNAICRRFQNIRGPGEKEPLAMFEVDPLRPLSNLLWGWIQDEQHRLSVRRRAFEYDHHYGFRLYGKVIPKMQTADSRSKFLEAYNNLLYLCARFFRGDDDTTVVADGFPVLNALKEVHFILAEGAHNQFRDLPATSRMEMLMMEWILARPEFREFLPSRAMVAYPEPWMDRVDAMKSIQGWTDVPVMHFRDLGVHGEQILLSIRFGSWSKVEEAANAANWARFWRPQIQNYMHAYRAITGVDLTAEPSDPRQIAVRNLPPSVHLSQRMVRQGGRK